MIRVVRSATLRELREDVADADEAARIYEGEADKWNAAYVAEVERADDAEELDEARTKAEQQFEGLLAVIRQVTAERDAARAELGVAADPAEALAPHPADGEQATRHAAAEAAGHLVSCAATDEENDR